MKKCFDVEIFTTLDRSTESLMNVCKKKIDAMVLPRVKMFEKGISAFLFKKITGSGAINFETRQLLKAFKILFQLQICQKS